MYIGFENPLSEDSSGYNYLRILGQGVLALIEKGLNRACCACVCVFVCFQKKFLLLGDMNPYSSDDSRREVLDRTRSRVSVFTGYVVDSATGVVASPVIPVDVLVDVATLGFDCNKDADHEQDNDDDIASMSLRSISSNASGTSSDIPAPEYITIVIGKLEVRHSPSFFFQIHTRTCPYSFFNDSLTNPSIWRVKESSRI